MAALEQSLDVPGDRGQADRSRTPTRDAVVARAKELMDKELLAMADDIATHPEIGFEEKRSIGKLTDYLRQHDFSVETGSGGLNDRVRRQVPRQQRRADARRHPRVRRAARHQGRVPRRPAQRAGPGRHGRGDRDRRVAAADQIARQRHRLRHAGRRDDAAEREDRDARGARLRRRRHHRPQPRVEPDVAPGATASAPAASTSSARNTRSAARRRTR